MSQQQRTLLIVDDSPEDRELYRRYLLRDREYSYTFLEATLGRQGLELWQQHQPDVILLDYRLPDLDGLEFLAQLQPLSQRISLPVIVVTGQGNEAIAVQAMKAGAQDYLVKEQISPEGLQIAVNGAIETVRLRTQLQQRIERDSVISYITQQIHKSLNLDEILQTTVAEVRRFLHTDRVLVFQLNLDGDGTVVAESVGAEWRSLLPSTIHDPCQAGNSIASNLPQLVRNDPTFIKNYIERYYQGQVVAVADIHDSSLDPCHGELLAFQVKAHLVVPILQDNQFWGLLIAHNCTSPRFWQPLEIDLLKELATQMSIALRQAQLYQQAQRELKERQQVEAELRQSEEQLRLALLASRMATWNWNIQTGKITWSNNLEALFGLQAGEFDGSFEMFAARLHLDDRDRVLAAVDRAVATGEDYNIEFRVAYPNGTIRWAHSQGKVFYDHQGQPMQMAGNDIDITERKRSAEALRESEERFRQIAENIDAVFWIREVRENRVSYVSPAYKHLWGFNPEELYQGEQSWIDRIHPEDRELTQKAFHEKAVGGEFDQEYRIILADGSIRWVHDRCFPLRDETGEIYRFAGIAEDISERKRYLAALEKSEERFRTSVENMLDCFGIYQAVRNEQGQIVDFRTEYVNDAACLNNQVTRGQQIGRGLCELLPVHRDSGLFDEYCQVVETGQALIKDSLVYEDEYGQQRLVRAFDIRVAKFGDGFVATWRDITARQQTEVALRQSEEFKNRILDSSSDCIQVLNLDGRLLYMNTGGMCLMEIDDLDSYLNTEWLCFWESNYRQQAEQALAAAKIGEISIFRGYCPTVKGTPKWWEVVVSPILDASGEMERILLISRDITDRKQVEEALRQSEERYRCLAELIPQLVWTVNPEGALLDANQRWLEYTGLTPEQAQTMGWKEVVHPEDILIMAQQWSEAVQHSTSYQAEGRIRRADGVYRWHLHQAIPQKDEQGEIVKWFGSATDIEAQKQLEAERDRLFQLEQAARTEAERANRIKDEFLAILSHELRSPLNPILGWTKLLQTRKFNETKTAEALAIIERNAKLQTQLIDDLLDVAKILRGKLSINAAPVNLAFVIESAIDTVSTTAVAKSILLHPVLPNIGQVSGDSNRLQQIVWNLLSNAIKFTPKGGRVEIRLERVGDQAQIIVSDTGKGINPDFLPYIFESFRQEDVSVTRKFGGLGLGLAIVRQLVEAHGGAITADSPGEGLGATFTVQLPLLNVQPEIKETNELSEQALELTGIRVLTVDDDPDARELLTVLLTEYGAQVLTVTSAAEVLANLESFQPDVLVSDIGMPEVDGYSLIQQIRTLTPEKGGHIPAIALTAYARVDDYERAISSGYQLRVTKPLEPEELVQAVVALAHNKLNDTIPQNDSV
ncbi:PAS domain-containing protein [Nostoc flagelliforme FACHB-838]|uniref:histidine kinase n=1 Tax=Nostoc flagelliforme FACHB-838 TaxID=2692904 RepID=A0ABR8DT95_9NOSO|nr:PAS domain-containing protein [Nostoc flagelliforme]MBD2532414.1 PAS domain-containing protein [Nostoc flagelliforme FACHB-838]